MAAPMLKGLSYRHEALLNWFDLNPDKSMTEGAQELGYTLPWVSQIYHSDMFQAELGKRRSLRESEVIRGSLDKIGRKVLTKIEEHLDEEEVSEKFLTETAAMALDRLGYAAPKGGAQPAAAPYQVLVNGDLIIEAREQARAAKLIELNPQE